VDIKIAYLSSFSGVIKSHASTQRQTLAKTSVAFKRETGGSKMKIVVIGTGKRDSALVKQLTN